jgi:hypothetical protein
MTTKNIDFETLFNKISGKIKTTASHIKDNGLFPLIVRGCRLRPYSIFQPTVNNSKTKFEYHWVDEFGNSLKVEKAGTNIIMNDVTLDDRVKISSDLFFGTSIDDTAQNSKAVFIVNGKYDNNCCFLTFYGNDEYLRSFFFFKKMSRVSSLLLGMNTMRELFRNFNSVSHKEINMNKIDLLIKFDVLSCLVCWQPSDWKKYIKGELK